MRGHIEKRGKTWSAVIDMPRDPVTGKRRQKRITAPTKREAEAKMAEFIASVEQGGFTDPKRLTVREYLEQWLRTVESTRRPSTYRRYADLMRKHVVPIIGNVQLAKLTPLHIQRLYADRLEAELSPSTVNLLHNVLHRSLKQAVRWGLLSRNVTELVDAPQPVDPETKTWTAKQVAAVLNAAKDSDLEALWRLALFCGLRQGELLGLRWSDVDFDRATLAVQRTLSRGSGGTRELGPPKTAHGRRSIALPVSCVDSLRRHRVSQLERRLRLGELWADDDFVFTNQTGGPLAVNVLGSRFRKLIAAAGVPGIRFHDMRHSCATLLLEGDVHPKVVQERLGHANVGITLNRYSHVSPQMQRAAADALEAMVTEAGEVAS